MPKRSTKPRANASGVRSLQTPENLDLVCDLISVGQSLQRILDDHPHLGSYWSFVKWMREDDVAAQKYARARVEQADWYADQIAVLAVAEPEHGEHGVDSGEVAHRRLAIDALKWLAGKRKPKVYGDKEAGVNVAVGVSVVGALTEERRMELIERRKRVILGQ